MDVVHLGEVGGGQNHEEILAMFDDSIAEEVTVGFSEAAVASAFVLCTKVIGKRATSSIGGGDCNRTIVINDGVFGHFGKLLHSDRPLPNPRLLRSDQNEG